MPNHITNVITINGVSDERRAEILAAIKFDNEEITRNSIDFEKLIPMPEALNVESGSRSHKALELYKSFMAEVKIMTMMDITGSIPADKYQEAIGEILKKYEGLSDGDEGLLKFGEQLFNNTQNYGASDWYEWCPRHWGTKWNSYGYDSDAFHDADNQIEFLTAWNSVPPIMERLSEMFPDAEISYRWADEDFGANVGEQVWQKGEIIDENIPQTHSAAAYEMAATIIPVDLEELGYVYSEKEDTYHYQEEQDIENTDSQEKSQGMGGIQ